MYVGEYVLNYLEICIHIYMYVGEYVLKIIKKFTYIYTIYVCGWICYKN